MADPEWCTIESDPGVFTELLKEIGVENVQVEELYSLDKHLISQFGNVYGIIFLFKYRPEEAQIAQNRPGKLCDPIPQSLFFAKQTITNACATQALLSIVMNQPSLSIGAELSRFKLFSQDMDPVTKGMLLSNSNVIRTAHNSFAPPQTLQIDHTQFSEQQHAFHFVAYIPHKGNVYELDGLQQAPRQHVAFHHTIDWLDVVTPIISNRINEYNGDEIRFNIMLLVEDPRQRLQHQLTKLLESHPNSQTNHQIIISIQEQLAQQKQKHQQWLIENTRRRSNFIPFIACFLKTLAKAGQAELLIKDATEKKELAYAEASKNQHKKQP